MLVGGNRDRSFPVAGSHPACRLTKPRAIEERVKCKC